MILAVVLPSSTTLLTHCVWPPLSLLDSCPGSYSQFYTCKVNFSSSTATLQLSSLNFIFCISAFQFMKLICQSSALFPFLLQKGSHFDVPFQVIHWTQTRTDPCGAHLNSPPDSCLQVFCFLTCILISSWFKFCIYFSSPSLLQCHMRQCEEPHRCPFLPV